MPVDVVLLDAAGRQVRELSDPAGGVFDADRLAVLVARCQSEPGSVLVSRGD